MSEQQLYEKCLIVKEEASKLLKKELGEQLNECGKYFRYSHVMLIDSEDKSFVSKLVMTIKSDYTPENVKPYYVELKSTQKGVDKKKVQAAAGNMLRIIETVKDEMKQ